MKKNGFTVIEFVAVFAVTLILAALLMPALFRAREMGRSAKCVGQLKSLVQAVRMYVEDEPSGRFPGWSGNTSHYKFLMGLVMKYLGAGSSEEKYRIFRCPSNDKTVVAAAQIDNQAHRIDYEYNAQINNAVAHSTVVSPEWVSVLYDWPPNPSSPEEPVHRGGSNIAFYDGHVQWFSRDDMLEPHAPSTDSSRKYDTWGIQ